MAWVGRRLRHRQCIRLGGKGGTCIDRRMDVVLETEIGISSPTLISCSCTVGDVRLVRRRGFRRLYGPRDTPKHAVTSSLERQPLFPNARPWRSDTAGRPDLGVVLLIPCSPSTQEGGDTRRSCQIVSRKREGCIFPDSSQRSVSRSSSCVARGQGLRLHPIGTGGEDR